MSDFQDRISKLSPGRLALLAVDLQSRLEALEGSRREAIAVIGIGCRFPGGASGPESFWRLLRSGTDAVGEMPAARFDLDAFYDPNPDAPGKLSTRQGGFLGPVDGFDPEFFGISPREALSMDPQQRLLLEVAWEALEHAGQSPEALHGSRTGVFLGMSATDYYMEMLLGQGAGAHDAYLATGNARSVASGRISYLLGLRGPSLAVDTACSSSLVAVHLACQSLRSGGSRMALAAGVNLILSPDITITLSKAHMLAPDGRCKTFDSSADGFGRGEGCGVVVLKRLSDALADGDRVLAVIRGSAVNQDGRSSGLTAPNGPAQEDVIREALADAGIEPSDVGYVEAHGTGTSLGDPIEVRALGAVLGAARATPLLLGSVKTNIAHLEAAAGVAGLIKVVLSLQHREIPPHLHLRKPNSHIAWDELPVRIPTEPTPWPAIGGRFIAGLSSFGFSGTNAHVIVEAVPATPRPRPQRERPLHLLTVSARSPRALGELAEQYAARVEETRDETVGDLAFTANSGRSHLPYRLAVRAASNRELADGLRRGTTGGDPGPGVWKGHVPGSGAPEVAFLFTGQGSQYAGMGRELFETQPTFRRALERCDEILRPRLERPLLSVLYPEPGQATPLDETAYTQPALFALEYALAELWRSFGVLPSVVMGHSVGEYVAACVAGVFTLEDGLGLIAERGRLMQALPRGGEMAAVFADEARVRAALTDHAAVSIAAVNGPDNVVISGEARGLETVLAALRADGVKSKGLTVSHAFHSALMDPILDAFEAEVGRISLKGPRTGLVSNLSGALAGRGEVETAGYWRRHLREPVRFSDGMRVLAERGSSVFVEIGPGTTLLGMGRRCVERESDAWLSSLRKGRGDWEQILESLAGLYVRGVGVDWKGFDRDYPRQKVALPTYPFERERYWVPVRRGAPQSEATPSAERPPFADWLYETVWRDAPLALPHGLAETDVPPLAAVVASAERALPALVQENALSMYDAMLPRLDALCAGYALEALRDLGWHPAVGEEAEAIALAERLGVTFAQRPLFRRLLGILAEDGFLAPTKAGFEVRRPLEAEDTGPLFDGMIRDFPAGAAELNLTGRCGARLADALRGRVDPLQLLFPGGSLGDAEKLYQEAPASRAFGALVRDAVSAAIARVPAGRRVRILEIGGGTGGTTAHVLPALPKDRAEYVFTDVSRVFLVKAQAKFKAFPFVSYELLDIEADPAGQALPAGTFDVVIAANVLHATRDLRKTLANVRRLMAGGGVLVLLEGSVPHRFGDLTVGLTEGWWHFADKDLRSYALIPPGEWRRILEEGGFAETASLPTQAGGPAILGTQAVVLARAAIERPTERASTPAGRWIVLADDGGVGEALAVRLRAEGDLCTLVRAGDRFEVEASGTVRLDPARPEDFRRLLGEAGSEPWKGAVHLWGLDQGAVDMQASGLIDAEARICGSLLHLVQALAGAGRPGLWAVTRGAQRTAPGEGLDSVVPATVWGLGKVVSLEHPELACVRVDLDPATGSADEGAAFLFDEIRHRAGEDQVAVRGGVRRVARLARMEATVTSPPAFSEAATYLITGGLSGLGLQVARFFVAHGARHLVLMGRRGAPPAAEPMLREMATLGADVRALAGDVADEGRVRAILDEIARSMPPLRGVVHAAGVLDDAVLEHQDWSRFERVLGPKVRGGFILHELTRTLPLEFFVLFSSGASLIGSPGQGNHAAANAFLDALAHHRHGLGLPALSINWGAWAEVGAAADRDLSVWMTRHGMDAIVPSAGLDALGHLMGRGVAQAGVLNVNWAVLSGFLSKSSRFYSEVATRALEGTRAEAKSDVSAAPLNLLEHLEQARPGKRRAILHERIRGEAMKVLGLGPTRTLEPDRPLQELGLDSLMAVELRNAVGSAVGRSLSATLLFDYPTLDRLVGYLSTDVLALERSPADVDEVTPPPVLASAESEALDGMSVDEMAALLEKRLGDRGEGGP